MTVLSKHVYQTKIKFKTNINKSKRSKIGRKNKVVKPKPLVTKQFTRGKSRINLIYQNISEIKI